MSVSARPEAGSLSRWYIDTFPKSLADELLPLLSTLQREDQEKVERFMFLEDRNMHLASFLLKYLFIHRSCLVPWSEICIRKTPAPHGKPYYILSNTLTDTGENVQRRSVAAVEFNVSHQASLTALTGYVKPQTTTDIPSAWPHPPVIVGIDITCTDEPSRSRRSKGKRPVLDGDGNNTKLDLIRNFSDIFSDKEMAFLGSLRLPAISSNNGIARQSTIEERRQHDDRIFFTYWALKEAYVKMAGKGLLDPLVRSIEFRNVIIPEPVPPVSDNPTRQWGPPLEIDVFMFEKKVEDVRIELAAWGHDFLVATAGKSISDAIWEDFKELNVDRDISTCAKGKCDCLPSDAKT